METLTFQLSVMSSLPWNLAPGSFLYWTQYSIELWAAFTLWSVTASVDIAFTLYVFQMCKTLRYLQYKLENLREGRNYQSTLRECIKKYSTLLRHKLNLQKLFGISIIFSNGVSALIFCGLIYQITKLKKLSIVNTVRTVLYISLKVYQILVYSLAGELLVSESSEFRKAAYNCGWPEFKIPRNKYNITIILSQRPMSLRIVGFFVVTLQMFMSVIHAAGSYFFLLQSFDQ